MRGFDVFNIIERNSWLIIDDLAESIEQWSQVMLQLFKDRSVIFTLGIQSSY